MLAMASLLAGGIVVSCGSSDETKHVRGGDGGAAGEGGSPESMTAGRPGAGRGGTAPSGDSGAAGEVALGGEANGVAGEPTTNGGTDPNGNGGTGGSANVGGTNTGGTNAAGSGGGSSCAADCTSNNGVCFEGSCIVTIDESGGLGATIDGNYLYVANLNGIRRVPLNGGAGTDFVPTANGVPSDVAVDAQYIYWSDRGTEFTPGGILRADKATGANVITLEATAARNPQKLLIDSTYIYWANFHFASVNGGGGLYRKKKDGSGSVTTLDAPASASGTVLAFGAKGIFWADEWNSTIRYVDLSVANPTGASFSSNESYPNAIATSASDVFWMNATGKQALVRGKIADMMRQEVVTGAPVDTGEAIGLDQGFVYFAGNQNGLYRANLDGTSVKQLCSYGTARALLVGPSEVFYFTGQASYRIYPK